jgi:hypothetical protein
LTATYAAERGKRHLFAWATALLFLTRPEGVLCLVAAGIWTIMAQRRAFWRPWVGPALVVTSWYGFLLIAYGTVVPHAAEAKKVAYHSIPSFQSAADIVKHVGQSFLGVSGAAGAACVTLIVAALVAMSFRPHRGLVCHGVGAGLVAGFFVITRAPVFSWYLSWFALMPALTIPAVGARLERMAPTPRFHRLVVGGLYLLAITVPATGYAWHPGEGSSSQSAPAFWWSPWAQRLLLYGEAGEHLNRKKQPVRLAATAEPGAFGYAFKGRVLDLDGLVSHEMLRYFPVPWGERSPTSTFSIPVRAIKELRPDYVLFFDTFGRNGILEDQFFREHYRVERFWPLELWGSRGLYLFVDRARGLEAHRAEQSQ